MLAVIVAVFAMPAVVALFFASISVVLGLVPVFGMVAAERYIVQWVIEPEGCQPLSDRDTRLLHLEKVAKGESENNGSKQRVAVCVRVSRDKDMLQGRVAFAAGSAVILFCSKTGRVFRVPTEGAQVEVIAAE